MARALVALVVVAFVLLVVFFFAFVKLYRIPSSAMEPTLRCDRSEPGCSGQTSDRVLAVRLRWPFRGIGRGDIVAFHTSPRAAARCGTGGVFVKRVIALPGETFAERKGAVYVDGRLSVTLKGDRIVAEFLGILEDYVAKKYPAVPSPVGD